MPADLPSGTLTLLFTDIEGSTRLLQAEGDRYTELLSQHNRIVRAALRENDGVEVHTQGDSFFAVFTDATAAVRAAAVMQERLRPGPVVIRIGVHTGEPQRLDDDYAGLDVHVAARISAAAHGGQVVLSARTRSLLDPSIALKDLGLHRLKDLDQPQRLFQLGAREFPPLRSRHATNLPNPPTAMVGREVAAAELRELVGQHRLVTMVGPGGVGKTRLALHLAHELVPQFVDGVFWVPLASVPDPSSVTAAIAQATGAPADLAEHVEDKQMLLLVDNVERRRGRQHARRAAQPLSEPPHPRHQPHPARPVGRAAVRGRAAGG